MTRANTAAAPAVLLAGVLWAAPADADTLHVPKDYPTIQAGIDAAQNGDIVLAAGGVYIGAGNTALDFGGRSITVRSENGPDDCTIDCQGDGRALHFHSGESADAVLDGFTITGGYVTSSEGGGLLCESGSSPTILNCAIANNAAEGQWGGGLSCVSGASPTVRNCVISGNFGASGGGISSTDSSPTLVACLIIGNTAGSSGGGISCGGGSPTITNCTIADNTADSGGGIRCASGSPTITNCLISGNAAITLSGGGMYSSGSPTLVNCTIADNASDDYGDGIYCYITELTITNCILWNFSDANQEIALWWDAQLTISYSDVQNGSASIYVADNCTLNWGAGNIDADPLFVDPGAAVYGLAARSPCIDAGNNHAVLPDRADLDLDTDTIERSPLDLTPALRFVNDPATPDSGLPDPPDYRRVVDIGAYELGLPGDLDGDCDVDLADLGQLLANYGDIAGVGYDHGDLDLDADVDLTDLANLLAAYGGTCH